MKKIISLIGLLSAFPLLVYAATYNGATTGPELDYVHGVTSGIQAQLNAKLDKATFGTYSGSHAGLGANTYTGTQTAPAFVSNAADGTHYVQPYNSVAFSGTPAEGMIQTNSSGIGLYTSAAWKYVEFALGNPASNGYCLKSTTDGTRSWGACSTGTIGGSTGSTDNALLRADGTGGLTLQSSGCTLDDSGNLTCASFLTPQAASTTPDAYNWRGYGTNGRGFIMDNPAAEPSDSMTLHVPTTEPTANQVLGVTSFSAHVGQFGWLTPVLTSSLGTGVQTALGNAVNGTGGLVTYGQPLPDGVTATTQAVHSNDTKVATDAYVDTATPFFYSGTTVSILRENAYVVCTGDCTVTPAAPAAGKQFCVRNEPGGSYTITLAALGSGNYYEKPDHSGYGTANATFTTTAATTNQACFVGLDANHYVLMGAVGAWTAN